MEPRDYQLRDLHLLRLHLLQAEYAARLALLQRFSAFIVALFTEMYGFPLTIYFLSGWLQTWFPDIDWFSHDAGHLLEMLFGWKANPHLGPFHLLSFAFIGGGFFLISSAWSVLYRAQKRHALATTGPYAYVRHPQYVGFIMVMFGFLLQWPTILTLLMFRCWCGCMSVSRTKRSAKRSQSSATPTGSTPSRCRVLFPACRAPLAHGREGMIMTVPPNKPEDVSARRSHGTLAFLLNHGAPIIFAGLLWYVLWWGHSPELQTVDAAMWHVSWVGVIALLYVALQARAILLSRAAASRTQ